MKNLARIKNSVRAIIIASTFILNPTANVVSASTYDALTTCDSEKSLMAVTEEVTESAEVVSKEAQLFMEVAGSVHVTTTVAPTETTVTTTTTVVTTQKEKSTTEKEKNVDADVEQNANESCDEEESEDVYYEASEVYYEESEEDYVEEPQEETDSEEASQPEECSGSYGYASPDEAYYLASVIEHEGGECYADTQYRIGICMVNRIHVLGGSLSSIRSSGAYGSWWPEPSSQSMSVASDIIAQYNNGDWASFVAGYGLTPYTIYQRNDYEVPGTSVVYVESTSTWGGYAFTMVYSE